MKKSYLMLLVPLILFYASLAHSEQLSEQSIEQNAPSPQEGQTTPTDPSFLLLSQFSHYLQADDPASLFSYSLYDKEVEFFIDGYWDILATSSLFIPLKKNQTASISPPILTQTVDLTTWLLIDNHWYFESAFTEGFSENTVAFGYLGSENQAIQHIRLGNSSIDFPSTYPFIAIGEGKNSPGIMANLAKNNWHLDSIVRYQSTIQNEKIFYGNQENLQTRIPISNWVQGKWFVLPNAPILDSISIFIEEIEGTNIGENERRWRELPASSYRLWTTQGIVEILDVQTGTLAVQYNSLAESAVKEFLEETKNYFIDHLESTTLVENYIKDANKYLTKISEIDSLILQEGNSFSPFMLASRYASTSESTQVVHASSGEKLKDLETRHVESNYIELINSTTDTSSGDLLFIRTPKARYPLIKKVPFIYFPSFGGTPLDTDLHLVSQSFEAADSFYIDKNAIDGTISVLRNGLIDTAFEFDASTGAINFSKPMSSQDTIRIRWSETQEGSESAQLLFAQGVRWTPFENLNLSLAGSVSWSILKQNFSDVNTQSPGEAIFSFGSSWQNKNQNTSSIKITSNFAGKITNPDTIGLYRIEGMDSNNISVPLQKTWFTEIPEAIKPELVIPGNDKIILESKNRTNLLNTIDGLAPSFSESSIDGYILDFHTEFTQEGSWAGVQILDGRDAEIFFNALSSFTVLIKNLGDQNFDLYVQAGTGSSSLYEDPSYIRTWKLEGEKTKTWQTYTIELTQEDLQILTHSNNIRIIAHAKENLNSNIHFQVARPSFRYEDFSIASEYIDICNALKIQDPASTPLLQKYPDPVLKFNNITTNTVLKIAQTDSESQDPIEKIKISKYLSPLPLNSYSTFGFFVYTDTEQNTDTKLAITLASTLSNNYDAPALHLTIPISALESNSWNKVEVNLQTQEIFINEQKNTNLTLLLDAQKTASKLILELDSLKEAVYLDEFYFKNSLTHYALLNETIVSYSKPGSIIKILNTDILSNGQLNIYSDTNAYLNQNTVHSNNTLEAGISIFKADLASSITTQASETFSITQASHYIKFPITVINIHESFYTSFSDTTWKRENSFSLQLPISMRATVSAQKEQAINNQKAQAQMQIRSGIQNKTGKTIPIANSIETSFEQTFKNNKNSLLEASHTYYDYWLESFKILSSEGESDALKRKTNHSFLFDIHPNVQNQTYNAIGLSFNAKASSEYLVSNQTSQGTKTELNLSFPARVASLKIKPTWQRIVEQTMLCTPHGSYSTDLDYLLESIKTSIPLYSLAPISDLYSIAVIDTMQKIQTQTDDSISFSNIYSLSTQRSLYGNLVDLYIPQGASVSIKRETILYNNEYGFKDSLSVPCKLSFSSLNILGSYSALNLFSWYQQDEFMHIYSFTPTWSESNYSWNATMSHSLALFISTAQALMLDNSMYLEKKEGEPQILKDTFKIKWDRNGKDSLIYYLLSFITEKELKTKREDTLSFSISKNKASQSSRYAFDHILKTSIGSIGEIRILLGLAYSQTGMQTDLAEINLGLGGRLNF